MHVAVHRLLTACFDDDEKKKQRETKYSEGAVELMVFIYFFIYFWRENFDTDMIRHLALGVLLCLWTGLRTSRRASRAQQSEIGGLSSSAATGAGKVLAAQNEASVCLCVLMCRQCEWKRGERGRERGREWGREGF